jgi:hypothetical protein
MNEPMSALTPHHVIMSQAVKEVVPLEGRLRAGEVAVFAVMHPTPDGILHCDAVGPVECTQGPSDGRCAHVNSGGGWWRGTR